jgi:hypothetical protein
MISEFTNKITNYNISTQTYSTNIITGKLILQSNTLILTNTYEVYSMLNAKNRGLQLTELITYCGKLYSIDKSTGIIYEMDVNKIQPRYLINSGNSRIMDSNIMPYNGNNNFNSKLFIIDWCVVKDGLLYIGSSDNFNNNINNDISTSIMTLDPYGRIFYLDWYDKYKLLYNAILLYYKYNQIYKIYNDVLLYSQNTENWYMFIKVISTDGYIDMSNSDILNIKYINSNKITSKSTITNSKKIQSNNNLRNRVTTMDVTSYDTMILSYTLNNINIFKCDINFRSIDKLKLSNIVIPVTIKTQNTSSLTSLTSSLTSFTSNHTSLYSFCDIPNYIIYLSNYLKINIIENLYNIKSAKWLPMQTSTTSSSSKSNNNIIIIISINSTMIQLINTISKEYEVESSNKCHLENIITSYSYYGILNIDNGNVKIYNINTNVNSELEKVENVVDSELYSVLGISGLEFL